MEAVFEYAIKLFAWIFNGGLFWVGLVGLVFGGIGLFATGISAAYLILGKRVTLKVIALHEEARRIDDDDDAAQIAKKKAKPLIRAEFEVVDGPHKGITKKSSSGSTDSKYALGDVMKGYYIPHKWGDDIMSAKEVGGGFKFGFWMIAFAVGFVLMLNGMFISTDV